jgi:nucleoside-diphosphate-sugar epimerase
MRVLLTGASGFVGHATSEALHSRGVEVHAISHQRSNITANVLSHKLDLLKPAYIRDVVKAIQPEVIIHLAWIAEHGAFWTSSENLDWVNASLTLARAGFEAGARRFVGVGTCVEYELRGDNPCRERDTPAIPTSLYGVAKDATRRIIERHASDLGKEFAWARLFHLYGPREDSRRLIPSIARSLAANENACCSSGRGIRDFMDVRDAGAGIASLALAGVTGPVNIATGKGVSIAEVAAMLGNLSGRPHLIKLGFLPDRPNEPNYIVADVTRMESELNFRPARSLAIGLQEALEYWKRPDVAQ